MTRWIVLPFDWMSSERHLADDPPPAVDHSLQKRLEDDVRIRLIVLEWDLVHVRVLAPEVLERRHQARHVEPIVL